MRDWLSARTYNEPVAWAKVIVDEATDRILGAHMVGHAGEELIHIFAFAMKFGITAGQIRDTVYAFPTFSADIKRMLRPTATPHSAALSIQEPPGISVREPFDRSCVRPAASRPRQRNRGDHEHVQSIINVRALWQASLSPASSRARRPACRRPSAGECPADKIRPTCARRSTPSRARRHRRQLGAIDLEKEPANIKDRQLRFRKLTIEPGGIVPWHSHGDRPAIIYIQKARSSNTPATAPCRSCTRPATSGRRRPARRTGGRTSATRPSCSLSATSARPERPQHVTM